MNEKELKNKSKFLSLVLRHSPDTIGIHLDANGWAEIAELIEKCNTNHQNFDIEILKTIVETNDKKRFAFNEDNTKIRANQGHSIEIELNLKTVEPPTILYHGTINDFLTSIKEKGLQKMSRQHVHLSVDIETANKVASRRGKPIILKINAKQMHTDGFAFYCSENGVWLTNEVPIKYIDL